MRPANETPVDDIAVALLAAGRSTRFGAADKLTARLGDRPLIEWAASAGRSLGARHMVLVAGADASFDAAALGYTLHRNPHPERGMASSLRIAAAAAQAVKASALLILLADVPFVDPAHLARILQTWRADVDRPVFSSAANGVAQPPALFPAHLLDRLSATHGDKGARSLASDAALVAAEPDRLMDIDTPGDLIRAHSFITRFAPADRL